MMTWDTILGLEHVLTTLFIWWDPFVPGFMHPQELDLFEKSLQKLRSEWDVRSSSIKSSLTAELPWCNILYIT